jgi:hypothetical protein
MSKQKYPLILVSLLSLVGAVQAASNAQTYSRADLDAAATLRQRALADSTPGSSSNRSHQIGPRPVGGIGPRRLGWGNAAARFSNVQWATVPGWYAAKLSFR